MEGTMRKTTIKDFEELTLSNVWELEVLIAVLERKGVITKPGWE
jgi:hypothetical protein